MTYEQFADNMDLMLSRYDMVHELHKTQTCKLNVYLECMGDPITYQDSIKILQEGFLDSIANKVKIFFKKIWELIVKAFSMVKNAIMKRINDWIQAYKQLKARITHKVEVNIYTYESLVDDIKQIETDCNKVMSTVSDIISSEKMDIYPKDLMDIIDRWKIDHTDSGIITNTSSWVPMETKVLIEAPVVYCDKMLNLLYNSCSASIKYEAQSKKLAYRIDKFIKKIYKDANNNGSDYDSTRMGDTDQLSFGHDGYNIIKGDINGISNTPAVNLLSSTSNIMLALANILTKILNKGSISVCEIQQYIQ